jgi:hypothetical protein
MSSTRVFLKVICVGDSGNKLSLRACPAFTDAFPKPPSLAACCMQELERQPYCIKLYSTNSAPATGLQLAQTFYNTTLKLRCVSSYNPPFLLSRP